MITVYKVVIVLNLYSETDTSFLQLIVLPGFLQSHAKAYYTDLTNKEVRERLSEENKGCPGIYLWLNNVTGKYYVGQGKDLGDKKSGRIYRYLRPAYLRDGIKGASLIRNAMVKYGLSSFTLIILERCTIEELTVREQYWLDLLKPAYNILPAAKSSVGYTHTGESLAKMSGPRPYYQPTAEQNAALAERNRTREYTPEYRDMVSAREGHAIFAYDRDFKFLGQFSSIRKAKLALGVSSHTVTVQKGMRNGVNSPNVSDMIWSHTPLPYNIMS